ncbi:GcrA family cell cycle regulator [Candidatus Pelagibacter bacterium]|nr:GcrA family cell cycle regulator [Candidatus Pelagibacter bacterium]
MAFKSKERAKEYNRIYMRKKRLGIRKIKFTKENSEKLESLWLKGLSAKMISIKIKDLTQKDILGQIRYLNLRNKLKKNQNKLRIKNRKKIQYKKNKPDILLKQKKWAKKYYSEPKNLEKRRSKGKKDQIDIRTRLYEKFLSGDRMPYWAYAKKKISIGAKKDNRPFNITKEYLEQQWINQKGKCTYTNISLTIKKPGEGRQNLPTVISFDRRNNKKGYVKGNVHFVSAQVNVIKSNLPEKDFVKLCKLIYLKNKKLIN